MIALDVNVLLYAFREESHRHADYRRWIEAALSGPELVGLFEPVLAAVVRIATHPSIYKTPAPRKAVEQFVDACLAGSAARPLRADARHWSLFRELCERADCRGNLVQDAYLAALARTGRPCRARQNRSPARSPNVRERRFWASVRSPSYTENVAPATKMKMAARNDQKKPSLP